jgi:putative hydrolase of the HAD superfamily
MNAIVFDLDGTLLSFTREYDQLLAETFRAVDGESRDEWLDTYREAFYERFSECEPNPVEGAFGTISENPTALAETLHEREIEAASPPDGAHEDLARLAEAYEIGVVTNGVREWQLGKLRGNDFFEYVDAFVASYEVGTHKPDTEPFECLESPLPADGYAMVGDAETDMEGARRAGWASHHYQGDGFSDLPDALWE